MRCWEPKGDLYSHPNSLPSLGQPFKGDVAPLSLTLFGEQSPKGQRRRSVGCRRGIGLGPVCPRQLPGEASFWGLCSETLRVFMWHGLWTHSILGFLGHRWAPKLEGIPGGTLTAGGRVLLVGCWATSSQGDGWAGSS